MKRHHHRYKRRHVCLLPSFSARIAGQLIYYDFGMMSVIAPATKDRLLDMFYAVYRQDADAVVACLEDLGIIVSTGDRCPPPLPPRKTTFSGPVTMILCGRCLLLVSRYGRVLNCNNCPPPPPTTTPFLCCPRKYCYHAFGGLGSASTGDNHWGRGGEEGRIGGGGGRLNPNPPGGDGPTAFSQAHFLRFGNLVKWSSANTSCGLGQTGMYHVLQTDMYTAIARL